MDLEAIVLQVRLACEHYALLLQSACFVSLDGSERSKEKQFDAVRILKSVTKQMPHVSIVSLVEIQIEDGIPSLITNPSWKIDLEPFHQVYERGGNFLHVTNREPKEKDLETYLNNAVQLVQQLILVTWRHIVLLDGLAGQIVSQMLPNDKHFGFVLQAVGENVDELRSVHRSSSEHRWP